MPPTQPPNPLNPPDWTALRAQFPALHQTVNGHPLAYLDNAATSQKPRAVLDALNRFYERDNANVHRGLHELSRRATDAYEGARARVARFLNAASPNEIVFTRGATEAVNLVAHAWAAPRLKPGDAILLTQMEHHSNLVPWQLVTARAGASLRFVPVTGPEGLLDLASLDALLDGPVKLFAFTHVSNSLGTVNPARDLCARARARGIPVLIDAAQSAGHMPIDVQELGCDFLVFSGHKTCGPTGIGALYGRQAVLESMDPWQGGGEMIASVTFESSLFKPAPHRFEAGTPAFAQAAGLAAALDFLDGAGRGAIAARDAALATETHARLREIPGVKVFGPPGPHRGGPVSFVVDGVHAHDMVTFADQLGVALRGGHHCNQPLLRTLGVPSTARASFYFYNEPAEIGRLVEAVHGAIRYFRP